MVNIMGLKSSNRTLLQLEDAKKLKRIERK